MNPSIINFFKLLALSLWLFLPLTTVANSEETFNQANEYYSQGEYDKAVELYSELASNYSNFEIHYNLGNAYFKLNNIPKSILHYERALKINPYHEDALHNVAFARERTLDKIDSKQLDTDVLNKLISSVSIDFWAYLSVGLMIFGVALFWLIAKTSRVFLKNVMLYTSVVVVLVSFLALFLAFRHKSIVQQPNSAIIFSQKTDVLTEPTDTGKKSFMLHEGSKVLVLEKNENWVRISIGNDKQGWIKKKDCELI
jgi:tetratricopeptide (TPR) repeat protein